MSTPKPPDMAGAVSAIAEARARGRGRKSPVYLWLRSRHDELEAAFEENAPSWSALAKYLGDGGVMSGDGTRPTATSVRNAWLRVRKAVAEQRRKRGRPAGPPAPAAVQDAPEAPEADELPAPSFPFVKAK